MLSFARSASCHGCRSAAILSAAVNLWSYFFFAFPSSYLRAGEWPQGAAAIVFMAP